VLSGFQSPDGNQFLLVPFLIYTGNQYNPLPQEIERMIQQRLGKEDFLPSGGLNPNSPKISQARRRSILNRVRDFDVYRKGKKIGSFSITEVSAAFIGAITKVVGIGQASGFEPSYEDIAIAGGEGQQGFWSSTQLSPSQRRQLRSLALGLVPKVMPRNKVVPRLAGKRIALESIREQAHVLDLNRDGNPETAFEISAGVRFPGSHFNAYSFLLAGYNSHTRGIRKLLSSAFITEEVGERIYGDGFYEFFNAVDIDGDGVAEVILIKGQYEYSVLEIFKLRGGQLEKVCTIPDWSGS